MDKTAKQKDNVIEYISKSVEDTYALAKCVANKLNGGEILLLNGDLGAGKTTFAKGLAKALGIADVVTSPTFTFMKEYSGRLKLYHFDMYRAQDGDELFELGLSDYLFAGGVCVIEWNKFEDISSPINIDVISMGDDKRKFVLKGIDVDLTDICR